MLRRSSCPVVMTAAFLAFGMVGFASPARAQSILQELENKVRDQLELNGPDDKSGDNKSADKPAEGVLPAPTKPTGDSAGTGKPATGGKRTPPPTPTPLSPRSILEAPLLGSENTNTKPPQPTPEEEPPTGGVYLGLEAESLAGGGIGVRVVRITENSPAWRAGFKVGDTILAIDGFAIANLDAMVDRLLMRRPGDTIRVLLMRANKNVELTAVLQDANLAQRLHGVNPNATVPSPLTPTGGAWLGVVVADLSNAFRNQFGLRTYRAAAVTNVTKGSPADVLGIQPGDAIVGADSRPIESARDLLDWMATKRPGEQIILNVMRGTRSTILETTLASDPKFAPVTAERPIVDPFDTGTVPSADNTVPSPVASDSNEVQRLRGELKEARDQLLTLEQRVAELESLLRQRK